MYTKYKFNELTLTATNYNTKVSVELPMDSGIDDLFQAFKTIVTGLGYYEASLKPVILEQVEVYDIQEKRDMEVENHLYEVIEKLRKEIEQLKTIDK